MKKHISLRFVGLSILLTVSWGLSGCQPPPPPAPAPTAPAPAPRAAGVVTTPPQKSPTSAAATSPLGKAVGGVRNQIEKIQQHGLIDLEVQQQLGAVAEGYRAVLEQRGTGPADWNELIQAGRSTDLLRDAQQRGTRIAFGLSAQQWSDPAAAHSILAVMPNAETGGGWALEINGSLRELDAVAIETVTLANQ